MGKLIKNHWARLITLTAAIIQFGASLEGFFWPKIFWDFLTRGLDVAVKPFPILQVINLVLSLFVLAWEWPLKPITKILPGVHRNIPVRVVFLQVVAFSSILMYQSTNAAIYYLIASVVYLVAYANGETICPEPWTLPQRPSAATRPGAFKV